MFDGVMLLPFYRAVWLTVLVTGLLAFHSSKAAPLLEKGQLLAMHKEVQKAIQSGETAGAVIVMGQGEKQETFILGHRALKPEMEAMTADTVFDVASLTKVVATTTCILKLLEQHKVELDAPVKTWLPKFTGEGRDAIRLRHLLVHTSGLAAGISREPAWIGRDQGKALALAARPYHAPDMVFRYSDLNFILLGEIVESVSGMPLDVYAREEVFKPLGMDSSSYVPPDSWRSRIAPTAPDEAGGWYRGVVHDPTSRLMGGVTGHAGLFSTAGDLARFAQALLSGGELGGRRILEEKTVRLMREIHTGPTLSARRGLGWDLDSAFSRTRGEGFPLGTFGHTGFTGASMWLEPQTRSYVIVLTNRLHPDGKGNVIPLQETLATMAAEALKDHGLREARHAFSPRLDKDETPTVLNGIDVLARRQFADIQGLKVGLVTNHTGMDNSRRATIDLLHEAPGIKLVALFSPEHGIRGNQDHEEIKDGRDERTGLVVHSLYGERRMPSLEQLASLDALVFDIQDIGCRFYTYISTMQNCMSAAASAGKKIIILDRVNPLGGGVTEGPATLTKESFVGCHPIPLRHGMTVGELALMMNEERKLKCDLKVIPLEGWRRHVTFEHTGLPWRMPSPNMRTMNAAWLYPGVGLLESAISVGRGTDTPFELIGAPYVDDVKLAHALNHASLSGIRFVPERFTPTASTFKGRECGGVRMIITDHKILRSVEVGIAIACTLQQLYPKEFNLSAMNNLLLHEETSKAIKQGKSWRSIQALWEPDLATFKARRQAYLLYD